MGDSALQMRFAFQNPSDLGLDTSFSGTNNGTVSGALASRSDTTRGLHANFNGSSYITVPSIFGSVSSGVTLAAWIYVPSLPSSGNIFFVVSMGNTIYISVRSTGRVRGSFQPSPASSTVFIDSASNFSLNTWVHVAYTHRYGYQAIYVNGSLSDYTANLSNLRYNISGVTSTITTVGTSAFSTPNSTFSGYMDDVRLYTRELSAAEIAVLAQRISGTNLDAAESCPGNYHVALTPIVLTSNNPPVTATISWSNSGGSPGSINTATAGATTSTFGTISTGIEGWSATGTVADVNTLLSGLTFTPTIGYLSNFIMAVNINDDVSVNSGAKAITMTAAIVPIEASDLSTSESCLVNGSVVLTPIYITGNYSPVTATISWSSVGGTRGSINTGTVGSTTSSFGTISSGIVGWQATGPISDVNGLLGNLTFTPLTDYATSFTMTTSVTDVYTSASGSKAMTMIPLISGTNLNAAERCVVDSTTDLTPIVITSSAPPVTVTISWASTIGGSINTAISGSVTSTFGTISPGIIGWHASGATSDVNTLLNNLVFTPATGYATNFSMTVSIEDGISSESGSKVITTITPVTATNTDAPESCPVNFMTTLTPIVVTSIYPPVNVTISWSTVGGSPGTINTATVGSTTSTFGSIAPGVEGWSAEGSVSDVNALLANLVFTPTMGYSTTFTMTVDITDDETSISDTKSMTMVPERVICFGARTNITLRDGTQKPISLLAPGMQLKSPNRKGFITISKIVSCQSPHAVIIPRWHLDKQQNAEVVVSPYHLIFNPVHKKWQEAHSLPGITHVDCQPPVRLFNIIAAEGWGFMFAENLLCETCALSDEDVYKRLQVIN